MSFKENETKFLNFSRDDFIEHILLLETKLGKQKKRNEALFAELQRTEWNTSREIRELRIALHQAGGNSRKKINKTSSKKDKQYMTPNVAALKNEIRVLKATVRTYYDEVKRLHYESNNKSIDYLMSYDNDNRDNNNNNSDNTTTKLGTSKRRRKKKQKQTGTFEERMRLRTNMLAKRAEKRKERERILMEEKQTKQMEKIIRNKEKKQRAIEKIKNREEAAYQKRRDDTMKLIHEQFERELRLENEMEHDEQTINDIEKFRDQKIIKQKEEKKNNDGTIPMEDILSRLNDNLFLDGDESLSD
jgi:hypothetical protein